MSPMPMAVMPQCHNPGQFMHGDFLGQYPPAVTVHSNPG